MKETRSLYSKRHNRPNGIELASQIIKNKTSQFSDFTNNISTLNKNKKIMNKKEEILKLMKELSVDELEDVLVEGIAKYHLMKKQLGIIIDTNITDHPDNAPYANLFLESVLTDIRQKDDK